MKSRYTPLLFVLMLLVLRIPAAAGPGQDTGTASGFWWEVELKMSVTGSYRYEKNKTAHEGKYSFEIRSTGALEQDMSNDYILYAGEPEVTVLDWNESASNGQTGSEETNLKEKFQPELRLNYVLKESGKIYFDLEVFPKAPLPKAPHPFFAFLLPRSAMNKSINKKDKYNKNIVTGSNGIKIPEKSILRNDETVRSFSWLWRRNKAGLVNSHSVELAIKITRKTRDR